jgi:hypothetical protein
MDFCFVSSKDELKMFEIFNLSSHALQTSYKKILTKKLAFLSKINCFCGKKL